MNDDSEHTKDKRDESRSTFVRPPFTAFTRNRAIRIYRRNLPHWRQTGSTYFVTVRLADSIPATIKKKWEAEKLIWLKQHNIDYDENGQWRGAFTALPSKEQFRFQKHFNRQVQACLDRGIGNCWLRREDCIEIVRGRLLAIDGKHCHIGDFVIMPNHIHMLATPIPDVELETILKTIKGGAAIELNRAIERTGSFWQSDSYDHIVRSQIQLRHFRDYIAENPQKAGITIPPAAYYRAAWMDEWREK